MAGSAPAAARLFPLFLMKRCTIPRRASVKWNLLPARAHKKAAPANCIRMDLSPNKPSCRNGLRGYVYSSSLLKYTSFSVSQLPI